MYGSYGNEPQSATIVNATATTAGTLIIIPSVSTNAAGSFYITDIHVCNGITTGNFLLGTSSGVVAPTGTAIIFGPVYTLASSPYDFQFMLPMKVDATKNFVCTAVSSTTVTILVAYYYST